MKNKKILITSEAGFIGSHIVDELINDNEITIIDNLTTGSIKNLKYPEHENLNFIEGDFREINFDDFTS